MANGFVAVLCVLALQAAWINAAPAESFALRPRSALVDKHIVGGDYAEIEEVPYQLSIQLYFMHMCGASIISPQWAITAGHCYLELDFITKYTTWLTAGSKAIFPFILRGSKHFLDKAVAHPKYEFPGTDYDVAVMKVIKPFEFSEQIKSVPLPNEPEDKFLDFSQNATISGWGATEEGSLLLPTYLRKGEIELVTREACQEDYHKENITSRMLCAGGHGRGDSCQGDSGGPLVHKGHLIGIVSWGEGCNRYTFPGVYTNLFDSEIRSFIKEETGL